MKTENWQVTRLVLEIDARGVGHAVYTATGPERSYSLVAFGHDLPADQRSDRVIAEAWDTTFALFDGVPNEADIERLRANVPLQEAGRVSETELTLSRANRSVRLFEHVVNALAEGRQPDPAKIDATGYLMRTTAVYGSGKFGAADHACIADRPELSAPFQAEMLSVWLIRTFVGDLVEAMAMARAPETATTLDPALRRRLGIGNSTGLGMAPFVINHPQLISNWFSAREEALARVRSLEAASREEIALFRNLLKRARRGIEGWHSDHPLQQQKLRTLSDDVDRLISELDNKGIANNHPWDVLYQWAATNLGEDAQELLVSLMLEPYPDLVDGLSDCMSADESVGFRIDGTMRISALKQMLLQKYDWALNIDWDKAEANARCWYVSAEKLEPRLGERALEPIEDYEQPLAPGRDAVRLLKALENEDEGDTVVAFLLKNDQYRQSVRRAQIAMRWPYSEVRDNTIAADMLPIDLLRAKLSFFGAGQFDPRSDRWVRINMFRHAPYPDELATGDAEHWNYPPDTAR